MIDISRPYPCASLSVYAHDRGGFETRPYTIGVPALAITVCIAGVNCTTSSAFIE